MTRISTGTGIISGIDWGTIVDQLMALQRRPLEDLQGRVDTTNLLKTAYLGLSARLTALKSSASVFSTERYFSQATAVSSATSVMSVVVTGTPAIASHTFSVDRLVRAHHVVSRGYETANESAVGGTTLTIELGDAHLNKDTALGFLNGQEGVSRGYVRITDRAGSTALIDLSSAVTVNDVLTLINTQADANVTASLSENGIIITDNTGQTTYNLKVEDVGVTETATSLGIVGSVAADTLTGTSVNIVTAATSLNVLNDGLGVRTAAGVDDLRIVSSAGVVDINLSAASTLQDVLDAVNNDVGNNGNLTASLSDDGLSIELEDSSGGPINVLALNGSSAASDLGLKGKVSTDGTLVGETLIPSLNSVLLRSLNGGAGVGSAVSATTLSELNGGAGVAAGSIRIQDRNGATADVDLSTASTLRDVVNAINAAAVDVVATISDDHLVLLDLTGSTAYNLHVQEIDSTTAEDLGILDDVASATLTGTQIRTISSVMSLDLLNKGSGVRSVTGSDFRIWMNSTMSFEVDISSAATLQDVIDAINNAPGNTGGDLVTASIAPSNQSLQLQGKKLNDHVPPVEMLNNSAAAVDLGLMDQTVVGEILTGRVLMGDLAVDTRNELGTLIVTDRSGTKDLIDLGSVDTLSALLSAIDASSAAISASVNSEGNGIEITDTSGGTSNLILFSFDATASSLGIDTDASGVAEESKNGSDLDLRYLSENTRLEEMNGGQGVAAGKFRITNRQGVSAVVDLTQEDDIYLEDVIEEINSRGIGVTASINETGDGLLLVDSTVGAGVLTVAEVESGTTARDLNILGEADVSTPGRLDGSWEVTVDISGAAGLADIADAINASGAHVTASVINDGTGYSPYRLSIVSGRTGVRGQLVVDPNDSTMRFTTVQRGQDAVVRYGSTDPGSSPILLTSSTNSFDDAVAGLSLTVVSTSSSPVSISVSRDMDYIKTKLNAFVSAYNALRGQLDTYTAYNAETGERGILLGDATCQRIERSLANLIVEPQTGLNGTLTRLKQLGVSHTTNGQLKFDEETFYNQLNSNLESVVAFFTTEDLGFADRLEALVDDLTDPYESVLQNKDEALNDRIELFNKRIEEMAVILARREEDLIYQFTQMEMVLGQLQAQGSALSNLQNLVLRNSNRRSSGMFG